MELNGWYVVIFKKPYSIYNSTIKTGNTMQFVGKCENFNPTGLCAFSNDKNEMLLVHYIDILQMIPTEKQ
jgi:hypothetical protein